MRLIIVMIKISQRAVVSVFGVKFENWPQSPKGSKCQIIELTENEFDWLTP